MGKPGVRLDAVILFFAFFSGVFSVSSYALFVDIGQKGAAIRITQSASFVQEGQRLFKILRNLFALKIKFAQMTAGEGIFQGAGFQCQGLVHLRLVPVLLLIYPAQFPAGHSGVLVAGLFQILIHMLKFRVIRLIAVFIDESQRFAGGSIAGVAKVLQVFSGIAEAFVRALSTVCIYEYTLRQLQKPQEKKFYFVFLALIPMFIGTYIENKGISVLK